MNSFFKSKSYYVIHIPLFIIIVKSIAVLINNLEIISVKYNLEWMNQIGLFSKNQPQYFFENFASWSGVLYGFLIPLVLVQGLDQFREFDRIFFKEANSARALIDKLNFFHEDNYEIKRRITQSLIEYIKHVMSNFMNEANDLSTSRNGDNLLREVRKEFKSLLHPNMTSVKEPESLLIELLNQLDELINLRGERIILSTESISDMFRTFGVFASIIFLTPFYIIGFTPTTGVIENILVFGLTILVIYIYIIVDDLIDPFGGIWKIEPDSWDRILQDIEPEDN